MIGNKVSLKSFDRRYKFTIPGELNHVDSNRNRIIVHIIPSIWREMSLVGGGQYFVHVNTPDSANNNLWFAARAVGIFQHPEPHLELEICLPETAVTQPTPATGIKVRDEQSETVLKMSEIKLSGATLTSTRHIGSINDLLQIKLMSSINESQVELDCKIRYLFQSDNEYRYGVEFKDLEGDALDMIQRLPEPPDCA